MSPCQLSREGIIWLLNTNEVRQSSHLYPVQELRVFIVCTTKILLWLSLEVSNSGPVNKRWAEKMRPTSGVDHLYVPLHAEEHGKEKLREVKVPHGEVYQGC